MARKENDIDEGLLLEIMGGGSVKENIPAGNPERPLPAASPGGKSDGMAGYEGTFLRQRIVTHRSVVYISEETKRKLSQVVRRLGWGSVSLTTYVENILAHHLESHREEINRISRRKNHKDIL